MQIVKQIDKSQTQDYCLLQFAQACVYESHGFGCMYIPDIKTEIPKLKNSC